MSSSGSEASLGQTGAEAGRAVRSRHASARPVRPPLHFGDTHYTRLDDFSSLYDLFFCAHFITSSLYDFFIVCMIFGLGFFLIFLLLLLLLKFLPFSIYDRSRIKYDRAACLLLADSATPCASLCLAYTNWSSLCT